LAPRQRSELYRLGVGLVAVAIFVATVGRLAGARTDWWLIATIAVAGILALEFPLHISLSEKVSVASAVFFATVLLLPVWQAAALVGGMQAVDICLAALKKVTATRERPPVRAVAINLVFNGGQAYLSSLAAGLVLVAAGVSASEGLAGPVSALALIAAAITFYMVNVFLVGMAVALGTSRNPVMLVFSTQRLVYVQFASMFVLGAAVAFTAVHFAWMPLLAIAPGMIVYHSLRQRIEMRREAMRAMERMAEDVDRRDPYTYNHSQRVAVYTHAIARKLGLSSAEIDILELAAKVHDIGKIRIPDSVLLKPDKLTPAERRVMEKHPRLGFDILRPFAEYAKILDLVLTHHERYDGLGYPNGTIGRRLLLIAQVIPVADSLDAMTSARAYRAARPWESALDELRAGAGTQWNPHVVEAAVAVLKQQHDRTVESRQSPVPALA
jgi:putative nucleotidyltransferase with HDIG domain